eukprot:351880-Chlamydomonas_euryale.AAC.3
MGDALKNVRRSPGKHSGMRVGALMNGRSCLASHRCGHGYESRLAVLQLARADAAWCYVHARPSTPGAVPHAHGEVWTRAMSHDDGSHAVHMEDETDVQGLSARKDRPGIPHSHGTRKQPPLQVPALRAAASP